jgi:hypothetical protein
MIDDIINMLQNINDYHTPMGKAGAVIDMVGLVFLSFHVVGLGEFINNVFTPIGVLLTSILIGMKIFFLCASEYRDWEKRKGERVE